MKKAPTSACNSNNCTSASQDNYHFVVQLKCFMSIFYFITKNIEKIRTQV